MRVLAFSGWCACVAMAASGSVRAQDSAGAAKDAAAFDPFAASESKKASEPRLPAPSPAIAAAPPPMPDNTARQLIKSVDLLYQGKYTPGLISRQGLDQTEQDFLIDAVLGFSTSEDGAVGARLVANREQRKLGSAASHRNDVTALEYFYRQQFTSGTQALTVGRKLVDWSSGFQWRPANLIDNGFSTKNIEIQDPYRYRGVDQVRYELIQTGFDAAAIVSNHERDFFGGTQVAAKLSFKSAVDLSLMYAVNGDYSRKYGLMVDTTLGWGTTLALEAVHVDIDADKLADTAHFGKTLESLSGIRRYEDVYLSLTKFFDDKRRLSVEYFHNGRGLDDASGRSLPAVGAAAAAAAAAGRALPTIDPSIFSQQYLGRDYGYVAYTGYVDAWRLQFRTSVLVNTGDNSSVRSISVKRELGDSSELTLNLNTFHGRAGSDFGSVTNGVGVGVSYIFHLL